MNRHLQPLKSTDEFPAFRAEFARAFPSTMAPPRNSTGANSAQPEVISLLSDEDDDDAPARSVQASAPSLRIDLTEDSPEPRLENQPLKPPSPQAEPRYTNQARQSLPIQAKPSPSRSTPVETSQLQRAVIRNTSGPQTKSQPPSASRTRNDTTQVAPRLDEGHIALPLNRSLADEDAGEDEVWHEDLESPSKRPRGRPSSQNSLDRSTGTDSPLATRNKEKRARLKSAKDRPERNESPREVMAQRSMSTEQQSRLQQLDIAELEDSLHRFQQRVFDDHAETTRWLLHDAKRLVEEREPAFTDKVSPFASMQSVDAMSGQAIPEGVTKLKLDTYINRKKLVRSRVQLTTTKVTSDVPRVPRYTAHTIVKRNILCGDDEKLKFIPFLANFVADVNKNSFHRKLVKELDEAYSAQRSGSPQDSEWASKIHGYLDDWLEELDLGCDKQSLVRYILEEDSDDLQKSYKEMRLLRKSFGGPLELGSVEMARMFSEAFLNVFGVPLKDVILPDERLKEMLENAQKSNSDSSLGRSQSESPRSQTNGAENTDERLGTFTNLTCLICGAVCCQTHGDYNSLKVPNSDDSEINDFEERPPDEYQYTHQPLGMHYTEILRKQDNRLSRRVPESDVLVSSSVEPPCSEECFRTFDYHGKTWEWTRENIAAVKSFLISMRPKGAWPCHISFLLDLPCWQVHCKMEEINEVGPETLPEQSDLGGLRRSKAIDWYDNKRKTLKSDWQELTTAHLHQERIQANPCSHDGPCHGECPCAASNILCETFCVCSDDCLRKFTGCSCHSSGLCCVSETCICIAMNRECGPQCTSCGAIPRINPKHKYDDDLFATGCQNIVLQRAVDRKLMIGESQLEGVGFGLYLGEPVRKGEYLSEYSGEVISFAEADRRGIIYDRKYLSFLFDLNSEWCIDAARLGNKTRFINHADNEKDGLNCEAKIFLVNGEHRIKFVALRDIAVGEELLFNYGKKFAEKHGLNKKIPKAKEGGKKGVVVGEEALEALDGNRTRGRMTAIRGGHGGGRGGRKARKTAPTRRDLVLVAEVVKAVEEDEAMHDVEDDEEEDDDDEGGGGDDIEGDNMRDRRKKRKINRPKRYTR